MLKRLRLQRKECGSRLFMFRVCVIFASCMSLTGMLILGAQQQKLEQRVHQTFTRFSRNLVNKFNGYNQENVIGCVGWRETNFCHPYGKRIPELDKTCTTSIQGGAGYCLCQGGRTTARVVCGRHQFTCSDKCAELTWDPSADQRLPEPYICADHGVPYQPEIFFNSTIPADWKVDLDPLNSQANKLWDKIDYAFSTCGNETIKPPGIRDEKHDWVWDGKAMRWSEINKARGQWQQYLKSTPEYPTTMFNGRGIVIVGGGLKYFLPAWVTVHMVRKIGCTLPIEMWFPVMEYPTQDMEQVLAGLGVSCRRLYMRNLEQRGFSIKAAAIIMSRFQEVVFLDSDNLPIRDPALLLDTAQYKETGALLWPDFWERHAAPEAAQVLEVASSNLPKMSFESGQMVIDKKRHWRGLMLSIFMNEYHSLYYELLTSYMGKGDKDTFAYSFLGSKEPFFTIPTPVGGLGVFRVECRSPESCNNMFWGNTMVQHDTNGQPLFLHTNMPPKWGLNLPLHFKDYQRRWVYLKPLELDFVRYSQEVTGFDVEYVIYELLKMLKCSPFFKTYYKSRIRMGDPPQQDLDGFHNIVDGINFRVHYRKGLSGSIYPFLQLSMADRLKYVMRGPWRRFKASIRHWLQQNLF